MYIEKLNNNKIRIILNLEDLKENNVDFHSFMSNSIESQTLFLKILSKAESEIGFATENHRLIIEALLTPSGNFILTITRIKNPESKKSISNKVQIKRKSINPNKLLSIYLFDTFDEFCDFCTYLNSSRLACLNINLINSKLYLYDNNYYLVLPDIFTATKDCNFFHCLISEFALYIKDSELFERKLIEYGKQILPTNAIATCIKHFS